MKFSNLKLNREKTLIGMLCVALLVSAAVSLADSGECVDKYSFVNKRFACFEKHVIDKKDYRQLRSEIISYINSEKERGVVSVVSIFFRDLEAGPTMGIDERVDFVPASLLKLPNVLILMRLEEQGEIKLSEVTASYAAVSETSKLTGKEIRPNTPYTLEELITHSLATSDNLANRLIVDYISSIDGGRKLLSEIYRDLGILETADSVSSAVNTKGYSTIFRMLYNSSFLTPDSSEKVLGILANSVHMGGLRKGVPSDLKVAHKFGERIIGEEHQLHDCGVIYYPGNPYLLCVMTRGSDMKKLEEVIGHISGMVYKEFDSRRLTK